jgi:hypothetical protein
MAYLKTILKGTFGASEVWSTSVSWGFFGLAPDTPDQAAVDGILARLIAFTITANVPTALRDLVSNGAAITGWRVEQRSESEVLLAVAEGNMPTPVSGSTAASKTPQDALVFSLRTTTPGPRGRGRMYWPALGATLSASFQISTPAVATTAAAIKTWLNAIGSQINAYYASISALLTVVLAVRSTTDHTCRNVVNLQVGTILDTQRRRRDALTETYTTVSYP